MLASIHTGMDKLTESIRKLIIGKWGEEDYSGQWIWTIATDELGWCGV